MTFLGAENKEPLSIRLRKSFRESIPPCSYSRILFVNWISYLHFDFREGCIEDTTLKKRAYDFF